MKRIFPFLILLALALHSDAQKVLFLDAGHGGNDPGVIAPTGVSEAEINQAFVSEIKSLAESKGIKVIVVSNTNEYTPLEDRVKAANLYKLGASETAVLISINVAFSNDTKVKGAEVFVMRASERSEGSMELAQKMAKVLNASVKEKGLAILREATMPAILIETGYLSHDQEGMELQSPDMRTRMVRKIVSALE